MFIKHPVLGIEPSTGCLIAGPSPDRERSSFSGFQCACVSLQNVDTRRVSGK